MRSFSTVHDKHHKSLGRASYNKQLSKKNTLKYDEHKMPYIVDFATGLSDFKYSITLIAIF
jgi:U3 small nucleolar RNA-associated protein 21